MQLCDQTSLKRADFFSLSMVEIELGKQKYEKYRDKCCLCDRNLRVNKSTRVHGGAKRKENKRKHQGIP